MVSRSAGPRLVETAGSAGVPRRGSRPVQRVPIVVMHFGDIALDDTEAVARVAAIVVAEHGRGSNVVAMLPPYGQAAALLAKLVSEVTPSPHPRELDMLASSSSSMATALCAMAVHRLGRRAVSLEAADVGILTDGAHTRAEVVDTNPDRVAGELRLHGIVLVAARHGVARDSAELTTLAPDERDLAAVALAAALGAETCVFLSDERLNGGAPVDDRAATLGRELGIEVSAVSADSLCSPQFDASLRSV